MYQYGQEGCWGPQARQQVHCSHNNCCCLSHLVLIIIPTIEVVMVAEVDNHQYQFQHELLPHSAYRERMVTAYQHHLHLFNHIRFQRGWWAGKEFMTEIQVDAIVHGTNNGGKYSEGGLGLVLTPLSSSSSSSEGANQVVKEKGHWYLCWNHHCHKCQDIGHPAVTCIRNTYSSSFLSPLYNPPPPPPLPPPYHYPP